MMMMMLAVKTKQNKNNDQKTGVGFNEESQPTLSS